MTIINFYALHRLWQTPDLFPGRLEQVCLLRGYFGQGGVVEIMALFRSLPLFSSLSLSQADLQVVSEAMEAIHRDDADDFLPIFPEAFFEGYPTSGRVGATTWEEDTVADIQKCIPRVQLMSSIEIDEVFLSVWPTELSQWVKVSLHFTPMTFHNR
jgi:hypothetical protein